jgi:hypothetical protein
VTLPNSYLADQLLNELDRHKHPDKPRLVPDECQNPKHQILPPAHTKILRTGNTNALSAPTKCFLTPRYGPAKPAGLFFISRVLSGGPRMRFLHTSKELPTMENYLHRGNGDVQDAIYRRMSSRTIIRVGVERRLTLVQFPDYHLIAVGKHARSHEQDTVHIHAK